MSRTNQILLFIKKELSIRGSTPEEFVSEYDRIKSGFISFETMNRAFDNYNVHLRSQDFQELMNAISENGKVSVRKFLNEINNVTSETTNRQDHSKSAAALTQLAHFLAIRQMTLRDALRPYDRLNRGVVSSQDFIRAIDSSIPASIIAADYKDPYSDMIKYLDIDRDISSLQGVQPHKVLNPTIVDSIISQISIKNVPIRRIFQSYDREKNGLVSHRALPEVMERAGLHLTPYDIYETLHFYLKQDQFNYIPISDAVEERIREKESSQKKLFRNQKGQIIDTDYLLEQIKEFYYGRRVNVSDLFPYEMDGKCARYKFLKTLGTTQRQLSTDDLNAIADRFDAGNGEIDLASFLQFFDFRKPQPQLIDCDFVLNKIRNYLSSKRICLQRQCEFYDGRNLGSIAVSQLLAAFQNCGVQFNNGEFEALVDRYSVEKGVINYIAICRSVDDPEIYNSTRNQLSDDIGTMNSRTNFNSSRAFPKVPLSTTNPQRHHVSPPSANTMRIVAKIAEVSRNLEFFLRDEFKERDRARHSVVSLDDFYKILTMINYRFSPDEVREVSNYYRDNHGMFDYESFCRDIESCNADHFNRQTGNSKILGHLNQQNIESQEFLAAIRKYRAFLASRMLQTEDIFRYADPNGAGYIRTDNLANVLSAANIKMSNAERQQLINAFTDSVIEDRFMYRKLDARAMQEKVNPGQIRLLLNPEFAQEEETRELHGVLTEIREKLHVRRKNAYMIYCNMQSPTISPQQFVETLNNVGIILIHSQTNALVKKYTNGDMQNFDWQSFCDDCEKCALIGSHSYVH
ncbi:hypothetical protein TRFO_40419 [Tritrichomonas foetus]|uniref:EF-hand domain-containing protein n=1 Tax=Tritrichomonas foetus TaxID=1144522 RepID=A0A1J4J149_9EUKA|nr:hypothetical protein TRFO_40419 [Tritrichomonas foetus]|eukprot:OHS93264.1 hypothetical protein TRFO_40419 [Tritrichomonas foetus]